METGKEKSDEGRKKVVNLDDFRKIGRDSANRQRASFEIIIEPRVAAKPESPFAELVRRGYAVPTPDEMFREAQERLWADSLCP